MRKIIQIAFANAGQFTTTVAALADDGTVWRVEYRSNGRDDAQANWYQFPGLPQDEPVEPERKKP